MQSQVSLKPQINQLLSTDEKVGRGQTILASACTSIAPELACLDASAVLMRPNEWNEVVFQAKNQIQRRLKIEIAS